MYLPDTTFYMHEYAEGTEGGCSIDGVPSFEWSIKKASDLFANKKVLIFGLPGAFTPTCSSAQLPMYDALFDEFKQLGIDEIWCTAVNDAFVMRSWAVDQGLQNVKMLPDGNGDFAAHLGLLVDKSNLGFGKRSWRYAMIVDNLEIERMFIEDGHPSDLYPTDPFHYSKAEYVLEELKQPSMQEDLF